MLALIFNANHYVGVLLPAKFILKSTKIHCLNAIVKDILATSQFLFWIFYTEMAFIAFNITSFHIALMQ